MKTLEFRLAPDLTLEMAAIPAGRFLMGGAEPEARPNEKPCHAVAVNSFYLGKFPVTQAQWSAVMGSLPKLPADFRGREFPVVNVWLEKALEFCARLARLTGENFRLPNEAEWEYACRAGTTTPFYFGERLTTEQANFNGEQPFGNAPPGEFRKRPTAVGSFPPNAFGLYDLHGNVWEWCADVWHEDYRNAPADGSAWLAGGDRSYGVQRGGSWLDRASNCRSAFRVGDIAHNDENIVGLRVAL